MKKRASGLCNFYIDPELQQAFNEACLERKVSKGLAHKELHEWAIKQWIDRGKKISIEEQMEAKMKDNETIAVCECCGFKDIKGTELDVFEGKVLCPGCIQESIDAGGYDDEEV